MFCTSARRVSGSGVHTSYEVLSRALRVSRAPTRMMNSPLDDNRYNRFAPSAHARDDVAFAVVLTMTTGDSAACSPFCTSRKKIAIPANFVGLRCTRLVQNGQAVSRHEHEFERATHRPRAEPWQKTTATHASAERVTARETSHRDERCEPSRGARSGDRPEGAPAGIPTAQRARPERTSGDRPEGAPAGIPTAQRARPERTSGDRPERGTDGAAGRVSRPASEGDHE